MIEFFQIKPQLQTWLQEDIGIGGDLSSMLIDTNSRTKAKFVARESMVAAGLPLIEEIYALIDKDITVTMRLADGMSCSADSILADVEGSAQGILLGERLALNLLQHLSGVATLTKAYVDAVKNTSCHILDTRKTLPGLRMLQKYAVRLGGGANHRLSLDSGVLIKDNHLALLGGNLSDAVASLRKRIPVLTKIEVECETLSMVKEALEAKVDMIMLDNMSLSLIKEAVALVDGRIPLEVSGGVTLETVAGIAKTGIDYISVGKLTHSARAVDIGLDIN